MSHHCKGGITKAIPKATEKLKKKKNTYENQYSGLLSCLPIDRVSAGNDQIEVLIPSLFINQEELSFAKPTDEQLLKVNIRDLQRMELNHLISFLELFKQASHKP